MEMFEYAFMQRAFIVGVLLALIIPLIGVTVVLRRLSMLGDALSHTSLAGVAAGLLLNVNPVFGADYDLLTVTGDVPPGAELAVRIQGDSMSPLIADGSVVYVNHDPLQNGDVGIFCVDGDMLCKQYFRDPFGMVYLFSLNRRRADMDVVFHRGSGRSLTCFGRVMVHNQPLPEGHI